VFHCVAELKELSNDKTERRAIRLPARYANIGW